MSKFGYRLYRRITAIIPDRLAKALGGSRLLRPLRDKLLRRESGRSEIMRGQIEYEGLSFSFAAPYQVFYKAESGGIERRICRLAMSVLEEGELAVDVGSNYGFITMVMAKSVGSTGQVVSFEIDSKIANVLEETIRHNGMSDRARVVKRGAGAEEKAGLVTVDSVATQIATRPVAFIKIDVDGADFDVLKGAREVLTRDKPVVVVEMEKSQQEIYDLLKEVGYSHFMGMSNEAVVSGDWPPNLIASHTPVRIPRVTSEPSRDSNATKRIGAGSR